MKELQKYKCVAVSQEDPLIPPARCMPTDVYLASEADAAFAEMRREINRLVQLCAQNELAHTADLKRIETAWHEHSEKIRQQHAEEIERLTRLYERNHTEICEENGLLRKQAERYEKLRRLKGHEFTDLRMSSMVQNQWSFDDLVDQLPASGDQTT